MLPIITLQRPWMGWDCSILIDSSVDTGIRICTGRALGRAAPDSLVRCDPIAYLAASSNINIARDPLATDV